MKKILISLILLTSSCKSYYCTEYVIRKDGTRGDVQDTWDMIYFNDEETLKHIKSDSLKYNCF